MQDEVDIPRHPTENPQESDEVVLTHDELESSGDADGAPVQRPKAPPLFSARWSLTGIAIGLVLAGLQLALMRWLGVLIGVLIPLAILAVVVIVGVSIVILFAAFKRGRLDVSRWDHWFQRFATLIAAYLIFFLLAGAGQVIWMLGQTLYMKQAVQAQYGMRVHHREFVMNGEWRRLPVVAQVDAGGRFDRAGIQPDSVLLVEEDQVSLYDWLLDHQGRPIRLRLIKDATGIQDLKQSPVVTVTVPPKR